MEIGDAMARGGHVFASVTRAFFLGSFSFLFLASNSHLPLFKAAGPEGIGVAGLVELSPAFSDLSTDGF